ncbi:very-long-chain (3R)-3-hydroxyacyl-CoA dehydratase 4 isoform X2 [Syngnathoides biaculeatus]|uniref:very-long-chain (3R)-3-hydroxyacyl-CoA dehydratase 4 isoform X2 n=1 Tax=Syngnathoides biaculeatus TaxID=300417 RepID=UPI002ADE60C4|nr:very-long-chain (3R)-3-hydroxyacyl-CoA dehydratase 4 isoform X2 [Syngnathoides biaculeatus]
MFSVRLAYIFCYNLFQFCGHTWLLTNTVVRFLTFGQDALADTFHSVAFVMSLCQLLSVLELFHIADGIEKARLLPRLIQVLEKNLLLLMLILVDKVQSKPVVCVQLFFWNMLDLLRYPYEVMRVMDALSAPMVWARYTLWIPIYALSVLTEGFTICHAAHFIEQEASSLGNTTASAPIRRPIILAVSLSLLASGASLTVWLSLKERRHQLERWAKKMKRK